MSDPVAKSSGRRLTARTLGWAIAVAWSVVLLLWLADALSDGPSGPMTTLARIAVAAAALSTVVALAGTLRRLWAEGGAARWLIALVIVALALSFIGLGHEVTGRDFGDEGIYRAQAERINDQGQLLKPWFVYPHLLFYLDALGLWIAALFTPVTRMLAGVLYGVSGELPTAVLVTRSVTALLGSLTVVPIFLGARRLAGDGAALAAGALVAVSPVLTQIAHLNISDVPGAFFAAMTIMEVAFLAERERTRGYLLAGLWAGLAAGSKYPAGVVAVAILAVWLRWRLGGRGESAEGRGSDRPGVGERLGIVWAALAAMAVFVATTPSLVAYPEAAFGWNANGGADVFFGFRQYANRGWTGVVRKSTALYYLEQLVLAFGVPALAAGTLGLGALPRNARRRLTALLPFPVVYLTLLLVLELAVRRNLLPVLPALALFLGAGISGAIAWVGRSDRTGPIGSLRRPARVTVFALILLVLLGPPLLHSSAQAIRFARPTTREVATSWIEDHLPPGSFLVREAYTPQVGPPWRFPSRNPRFAIRLEPEELRDPRHDFLLVASASYGRFLEPINLDDPILEAGARRYREIFRDFELIRSWRPAALQAGPEIRLFRLDPLEPRFVSEVRFAPQDALLRNPAMVKAGGSTGAITYRTAGEWCLFKAYLEPGRYRIRLDTAARSGQVEVRDREDRVLGSAAFVGEPVVEVDLSEREKVFLYVTLPPGSRLGAVVVSADS